MYGHIDETAEMGSNLVFGYNVIIGPNVKIGDNVTIGNNVVIYEDTEINDNVTIADFSVLGKLPQLSSSSTAKKDVDSPLTVEEYAKIGIGVIVSRGTLIGKECVLGDKCSVRERVRIGNSTVIGMSVVVENDTTVGNNTKIQTGAYITAYVTIENNVFIAPMVTTTNDNYMGRTEKRFKEIKGAHIKVGARVGANSIILPGIIIGKEAFVAAGSIVTRNVPDKKLVMGIPAKVVREVPQDELLYI